MFSTSPLRETPHRRWNALTGEWVLVSPHRTQRPWQGQVEETATAPRPPYDPQCYLCPGNARAGGARNPPYDSTFVFDNDFAALKPDVPGVRVEERGLLIAESEPGICRVVCFSPRHDLTVPDMSVEGLRRVVDVWVEQCNDLASRPSIHSIQIFENRGAMMGASNPHPHCQIWSGRTLPNEHVKEQNAQLAYRERHRECLLCTCAAIEERAGERVICSNDAFLAIVPFWAVWPFEAMLVSRRHITGMDELSDEERTALADIMKRLTMRFDRLFHTPFPYTMGFHQRPVDGLPHSEWHFHAHYYPPLLRSATVRKFMVGYEMLASPQRDITAEAAAQKLREQPEEPLQAV